MAVTKDRELAYRSIINFWLKSNPEHIKITRQIVEDNKRLRETRRNDFASSKTGWRLGVSMPYGLLRLLEAYEHMHGVNRKFMATKKDLRWFARTFPAFAIWKRI